VLRDPRGDLMLAPLRGRFNPALGATLTLQSRHQSIQED
jgi:hypothetical protein